MYSRIDPGEQSGYRILAKWSSCRWHLRGVCAVASLTWLMWSPAVHAQDASSSLDELQISGGLKLGDHIYVTDSAGQRIEGDVIDISSSALSVTNGRGTWTFMDGDLHAIERRDELQDGIWLGAGAGLGIFFAVCVPESGVGGCLGVSHISGTIFAAIGAFIGWSIDDRMREKIYQKSGGTRLSVSTMLAAEHVGAEVSVGW